MGMGGLARGEVEETNLDALGRLIGAGILEIVGDGEVWLVRLGDNRSGRGVEETPEAL